MEKFNFKNYDRKNRNYGNNDLNIDRLSRELIDTPRRSTNHGHRGMQNQAPRVGVNLQLMSGQFLKTAEFTVDDIAEALDQGKRWLKQKNGGAINLRFVASYSPYKFYPKDDPRLGKQKR
ncbi:hypothetical protein ACSF83_03325 [Lactobacillus johnsonii]|uniref:hypothetical protein n=1 Tax=Lactobacillus johnsonii TaxID=33959 RepID=UPI002608B30D